MMWLSESRTSLVEKSEKETVCTHGYTKSHVPFYCTPFPLLQTNQTKSVKEKGELEEGRTEHVSVRFDLSGVELN